MESKENSGGKADCHNTDKQLIQYTSCPLLAFLDGCSSLAPSTDLEPGDNSSSTPASSSTCANDALRLPSSRSTTSSSSATPEIGVEPPTDLLSTEEECGQRPRSSSLIRLEPLTEAEASEASLFYLCELTSPDDQPLDHAALDLV